VKQLSLYKLSEETAVTAERVNCALASPVPAYLACGAWMEWVIDIFFVL
jgi:hypothetical protein